MKCQDDEVKGPRTPKLTYHFPKRAQFSKNFDSNIGTQRFVNTKKLTFKTDGQSTKTMQKARRHVDRLMTSPCVPQST